MDDYDILFLNQAKSRLRNQAKSRLWGVADLHTHPAVHLAFGADSDGRDGLVWGMPGWAYTESNLAIDIASHLPKCDAAFHSNPQDFVTRESRKAVVNNAEAPGHSSGGEGWPSFDYWPSAKSRTHQQMHISWIHRAWLGGLRLMVASAVDNQVISMLWTRYLGAPPPGIDALFDYKSAQTQLTFITSFVSANSSWMQIVKTAAEARQAINDDKLAVVLGLEMDQLTYDQMLALSRDHGVRLVTPIHLVDNSLGGAAAYDPVFNTANQFLNGAFFDVIEDTDIVFRFSNVQQVLGYIAVGAMTPGPYTHYTGEAVGAPGHRNRVGLTSPNSLKQLMAAGLLIDVSHMSQNCTEEAILLAETLSYPLLATHGGVRCAGSLAQSERDLHRDHARRIAALGGMLGMGTTGSGPCSPIGTWLQKYQVTVKATGGGTVGLGTDMNGLDLHISASEVRVQYPFTIPNDKIPAKLPQHEFQPLTLGTHTANFKKEGLAHYGMLPEFFHAVAQVDTGGQSIHNLFSSADAFVRTWERVEAAAQSHF